MLSQQQIDACSGIALLYMGPESNSDEYVERLDAAMVTGDREEAEHVSAVMLAIVVTRLPRKQAIAVADHWSAAFGPKPGAPGGNGEQD